MLGAVMFLIKYNNFTIGLECLIIFKTVTYNLLKNI